MSKRNQMSVTTDLISVTTIGDYSSVEDILRNNLEDVNQVNGKGWTPVMYAANYGHFNIIRLLIRYGCDVNHRDWQGRTPLMLAASNGHTRCLDVLISQGKASTTSKDLSGTDAYNYAKNCGHGNNKLIKNLLLNSERYELRGRSFNGETPAPSPLTQHIKSSSNKRTKHQIYNPYERTPFSSLSYVWRSNEKSESFLSLLAERDQLKLKLKQIEEKLETLVDFDSIQ